jgi:hypothetical protein
VWEDLFNNDYRERQDLIPKTFYKKYVEKNAGKGTAMNEKAARTETILPSISSNNHETSKEVTQSNDSSGNNVTKLVGESSESLNRSFYVRKKKAASTRNNDTIIVVQEDLK